MAKTTLKTKKNTKKVNTPKEYTKTLDITNNITRYLLATQTILTNKITLTQEEYNKIKQVKNMSLINNYNLTTQEKINYAIYNNKILYGTKNIQKELKQELKAMLYKVTKYNVILNNDSAKLKDTKSFYIKDEDKTILENITKSCLNIDKATKLNFNVLKASILASAEVRLVRE